MSVVQAEMHIDAWDHMVANYKLPADMLFLESLNVNKTMLSITCINSIDKHISASVLPS
uniref:Uncharacterized protein n=1 Tax=Anguilla anguilla TaxID=7936 RepID=A0A0E9QLH0_ANGAN